MTSLKVTFKKSSHEIDVDTYIGALRSLSTIAKEVNYATNKSSDIQLNVVAQKEGSFESVIDFVTIAGPILIQTAPSLLETVNIVIELYKIKKEINDISDAEISKNQDGRIHIANNEGSIIVNQNTFNIYGDNQIIQDALSGTFSKMTKDESVEGVKFSADGVEVDFDKRDFSKLSRKMTVEAKSLDSEVKAATLVIVKPILEKSNNKWTFIKDGAQITARIQDEDFLEAVANREYSFTAGDRLMVELLIKNEYNEQYMVYMPVAYSVLKVKDHITGDEAVQMNLL